MERESSAKPGERTRAGAHLLGLLANPLYGRILRAHADGALRASELSEKTEWPAQTTLRGAVKNLHELGILERRKLTGMPYKVATELTEAGQEALFVVEVVERWLAKAEQGPIPAESDAAKGAVKSLADGWNSTIVRALADEPSSLTELDRRIPDASYPSLERRLTRMRTIGQIEAMPGPSRGTPYEVTGWLRQAVAPLCAAGRFERRHMRELSAPITATEIEAAFLLSVPLIPLPPSAKGVCVLSVLPEAVERDEDPEKAAGVTVAVERGAVVSCVPEVPNAAPVWALGSPMSWLDAVIDGGFECLSFGDGRPQLSAYLVNGLHLALFGA